MNDLQRRMLGAARLDVATYEEVERDVDALGQALAVVLFSAGAFALATAGPFHPVRLVVSGVVAVLGWAAWAFAVYSIGTRFIPEGETRTDPYQFLRTLGFAAAPGVLQVIGIIGPLRPLTFMAAQVWMIIAMVVAIRQALDYSSNARALGVCLIGWCAQIVVVCVLAALLLPAPSVDGAPSPARTEEPPSAGAVGVVEPSGVAPPVN